MCLAVCGKIKRIDNTFASVDIMGIETCVNVELVEKPEKGDYVLIHAGFAIEKVDKEYFQYLDDVLKEMLKEDNEYDK